MTRVNPIRLARQAPRAWNRIYWYHDTKRMKTRIVKKNLFLHIANKTCTWFFVDVCIVFWRAHTYKWVPVLLFFEMIEIRPCKKTGTVYRPKISKHAFENGHVILRRYLSFYREISITIYLSLRFGQSKLCRAKRTDSQILIYIYIFHTPDPGAAGVTIPT